MWNLTVILDELSWYVLSLTAPSWLKPDWPPSAIQMGAIGGATMATLMISTYLYIRIFCDWIWDDIIYVSEGGGSAYGTFYGGKLNLFLI